MSRMIKMIIVQVVSWIIVGIVLVYVFTMDNTIEQWGDNRIKTILLAVLFAFGFTTDFILRMIERSKRFGFIRDERDKMIQTKSMGIALIVVSLYIFLLSISLYTTYEVSGVMPVGWTWFIAYSTVVMVNLATGIPMLYLYRKQGF